MFDKMVHYHAAKKLYKDAGEPIAVTAKELLKLFMDSGLTREKAILQVNIEKVFRAAVLIGDKLYTLKDEQQSAPPTGLT